VGDRARRRRLPYVLDPATLPEHTDALYRAAWALCGSRSDAEDLVQMTFVQVLRRPRIIRQANERAYLMRALRNVHASQYRARASRPSTVPLPEDDFLPASEAHSISGREVLEAIATAPPCYRDAVVAVDVLGLSYREAADSLGTQEKTVATRVHRGRAHVAMQLSDRSAIDLGEPAVETSASARSPLPAGSVTASPRG
jgi:RNA polymerase sigma-70 factor (ECF subfamily)